VIKMLWYKTWLDTRWRFIAGLALLLCSVAASVFSYPAVVRLLPMAEGIQMPGPLGERVREAIELSRTFDGYVWSHWVRQNFLNLWTLFAALIGAGGLVSRVGGASLFTMSLPESRESVLTSRVLTGLAELLALALAPSLLLPLLAVAVGERYGLGDSLVYAFCMFVAGAVFFSLAILLSTQFADIWRPLLIVLALACGAGLFEEMSRGAGTFGIGIFSTMAGGSYFAGGGLPWIGLLTSAATSAGLLFVASFNFARRDF
jgi:hypothetical protein